MELSNEAKALIDFVDKWSGVELFSTGANVVEFSDVLYNVDGSSDDPNINGLSWKQLLIENGVDGNCYVTNIVPPSGTSHPRFSVGGHMTVNSDGSVAAGGTCYLMPLCSWHNSKSRDGMTFTHDENSMIKLAGYMEGEPSVTFMARLPSDDKYSIVPLSDGTTDTKKLSGAWHGNQKNLLLRNFATEGRPQHFVLFKRLEKNGKVYHVVEDAVLPG